ncbi:RNA polymerase factor sigma-54 [Oceanisphaera avium]|uniref:RNA polymerase sigma-54 factor n=1 Tax=Oceanisphaera avium TaxID=1903694 RepID=A0A1Y0CZQ4_9GAMM|nr:RNA polymerase factor sigma-54 [Oceanisphaera avium]ART80810.1 RNA polymerase factor sigma-54 [Oceanisphaera avium]
MKPTLQLRMGQQLTMTPQLQQAIRLLQLSSLELQQEIQLALENNPLLEQEEADESALDEELAPLPSAQDEQMATDKAMEQHQLSDEMPMDTQWDDIYTASAGTAGTGGVPEGLEDTLYQGETTETLQDYLLWQMQLTPFSETDQAIALAIIDAIDDAGYLSVELEDILAAVNGGDQAIEADEVTAVLKRIQHFDPLGVGARSVQECLRIQLLALEPTTLWLDEALLLIDEHMELLGNRDYRTLQRLTRLKEDELRDVLALIQQLEPRPGNTLLQHNSEYVIPDVLVTKQQGIWKAELNLETLPKVRLNQTYAAMAQGKQGADGQFIRQHTQDAKWFIKSLESRNETLLKVANCIVEQQQAFFEYGAEAMKPMVLNQVAEVVEMHESTISRVTTQKFLHSPKGVFELKYFFSSHVGTESGGECSSTAIRAFIKKLVAAENPVKPLSDSKIAQLLAEQGIQVARRTIAKYRESLAIPPSNQRKRLL